MSFIALVKKHSTRFFVAGILLSFTSCGSFQYVGIYEDGIYHESVSVEQNQNEDYTSSSYYKNYFKEKSQNFQEENTLFTDADSFQGSYNPQNTDANNHAGWGQNNSSDVTINVYDNTPYFGYGWGSPYQNNWNWNMGWNNWMYGYGFQFNPYGYGYSPWNYPYWNYGYPGNGYYGYYGYYGNNNGGRSLAYINGGRNSRSRNYTPSSKLLNSTSRNNSATRSNTWSATNKTSRKSGAQPSSINTNSRPTTTSRSTSKSSNSPSRTTTTRSSTRSNSSSTTRSSRSSGGTTSRRRN